MNRRDAIKGIANLSMLGPAAMALLGHRAWATSALGSEKPPILVVLELSGGNDGLNTVVPYADDNYYRLRPTLGIRPEKLLALDEHFGFNPLSLIHI